MTRLSHATLTQLPASVLRPTYDRNTLATGIVHLGIGAFHRAHQAVYTEAALAAGDRRWGILGASLRSLDTRDALAPQDGLYTVATRDAAGERLQVVGAVTHLIAGNTGELCAAMASPDVRIVSLTITEKGYCRAANGGLDPAHPNISYDLTHPHTPRSAPGVVIEALRRRRDAGLPAFTVLCCDNLPANGRTVHGVLRDLASLHDPALARWVEDTVRCPSTMVDRIVPATTDTDRASIATSLGLIDAWPVVTEPFSQWVIEDSFGAGRPDWDASGANFVADVAPFELAKLRMLNGAHSALAYLGYLAGCATVAETMAMPGFCEYARGLMLDEAAPTLRAVPGLDLTAYADSLLERFRNPALHHRTWQIAMDGSQKLPQRLLGTVQDRLATGAPFGRLALAVAAWMRFVGGVDERGRSIDVQDPMAAVLRIRATRSPGGSPASIVAGLLGIEAIFGTVLPAHDGFRRALEAALTSLMRQGAAATVAGFAGETTHAV